MSGPNGAASGAGRRRADVRCPFCGAGDAEPFALFGSQLLTEQWYCRACHTPFERIKDGEEASQTDGGAADVGGSRAV